MFENKNIIKNLGNILTYAKILEASSRPSIVIFMENNEDYKVVWLTSQPQLFKS